MLPLYIKGYKISVMNNSIPIRQYLHSSIKHAKTEYTNESNAVPFEQIDNYIDFIIEDLLLINKVCEDCEDHTTKYHYLESPLILKKSSKPIIFCGVEIRDTTFNKGTHVLVHGKYQPYFNLHRLEKVIIFISENNNYHIIEEQLVDYLAAE